MLLVFTSRARRTQVWDRGRVDFWLFCMGVPQCSQLPAGPRLGQPAAARHTSVFLEKRKAEGTVSSAGRVTGKNSRRLTVRRETPIAAVSIQRDRFQTHESRVVRSAGS